MLRQPKGARIGILAAAVDAVVAYYDDTEVEMQDSGLDLDACMENLSYAIRLDPEYIRFMPSSWQRREVADEADDALREIAEGGDKS
jgi:hypothetical protein